MKQKTLLLSAGLFAFWFVGLFFGLPITVQSLDTGEMVANSYALRVIHPPGYPLFLWITHFFIHFLNYETVFWRASLLTLLLGGATFWVFIKAIFQTKNLSHQERVLAISFIGLLAFSKVFSLYSILPDVFMLNAFIGALICYVYFYTTESSQKVWLLSILLTLGMGNHFTIIFLAPLVLHTYLQNRSWKVIAPSIVLCLALLFGIYVSFFLMHPSDLASSGNIKTLGDVLDHFLRKQYGTFQLSGQPHPVLYWENMITFSLPILMGAPLAIVGAGLFLHARNFKSLKNQRILIFIGCIVLYNIVFLFKSNVQFQFGEGKILERFVLFPLVLMGFLGLQTLSLTAKATWKSTLIALQLLAIVSTWYVYRDEFNYKKNTIVEDYSVNFLKMIDNPSRAILLLAGDTRVHALRYAQLVLGVYPEIPILTVYERGLAEKLKAIRPNFIWENDSSLEDRDVINRVVDPNLENYDFYITDPIKDDKRHVTILGLGRKISKGKGTSISDFNIDIIQMRSLPPNPGPPPTDEAMMFAEYAHYYMKKGLSSKSLDESGRYFEQALSVVPYFIPALENICWIKTKKGEDTSRCQEKLTELQSRNLPKYY